MLTRKEEEERDETRGSKSKSGPKSSKQGETSCCQPHSPCQTSGQELWGISQKSHSSHTKTRIAVRYDVGFSNTLSIRGKGANLSWDRGIQLKNVKPDLWVWETEAPFTQIEFKVLVNDQTYEEGENRTLKQGSQVEYTPRFPTLARR